MIAKYLTLSTKDANFIEKLHSLGLPLIHRNFEKKSIGFDLFL
jgi:hypothetical protein